MEAEQNDKKQLPDYGKIIFFGIPLSFFVWVVTLFPVYWQTGNMKMAMSISILVSILFYVEFVVNASKMPFFCIKEQRFPYDENKSKKNVSTMEAVYCLIILITIIPGVIIGSLAADYFDIKNAKMAGVLGGIVIIPFLVIVKKRFFKEIR